MNLRRWLLLLLTSSVNMAAALEPPEAESLAPKMQAAGVPGLVITLVENGAVTHTRAYGVADVGTAEPLSPDAVFEAASLGKVIAAYQVLILREQGLLTLDDEIEDPRINSACGNPTIRQVLSHTAGLGNNIEAEAFEINCELKGQFTYAGEGFVLLREHLEVRLDMPVDRVIKRDLFQPLQMAQSTFGKSTLPLVSGHPDLVFGVLSGRGPAQLRYLSLALLGTVLLLTAIGFWRLGCRRWGLAVLLIGPVVIAELLVLAALGSGIQVPVASTNKSNDLASSLKTSAGDLGNFMQEVIQSTLISRKSYDEMVTPVAGVNAQVSWGLGIGIDQSGGETTFWHWGSNPGYQSLFVIDPGRARAVVILTSGGGFLDFLIEGRGGYDLARDIAREQLGIPGHWSISPPE